jgi:MFS family permease
VGAGFSSRPLVEPLVFLGVLLYGVGYGIYLNSWFPLISTIVPAGRRGRFFGVMRFIYQSVGIIFTLIVGLTLGKDSSIAIFQAYLIASCVFRIIGILIYHRLPELDRHLDSSRTILSSIFHVMGRSGYLPFCSYVFLLSLFTSSCQSIFSLLAKDTLGLPDSNVIFLGNLVTFGALFGYFCGGLMVDRLGTKYVFLFCHFSFASSLVLFLSRDFLPIPLMLVIGTLSFVFGIVQAASGIAVSSEMMAVSPPDNKPMATAVCYSLMSLGISLSGIFSSIILKLGILSPAWKFLGRTFGPYDALLLFCGVMIFLLTVTLGLVPSVVKKVRWD